MSVSEKLSQIPRLLTIDLFDVVSRYLHTRPWWVLIRVVPAVVILGTAAAISIPSGTQKSLSAETYRAIMRKAIKDSDPARAEFGFAALRKAGQLTTQDRFDRAMLHWRQSPDESLRQIREIVDDPKEAYQPALLWWATQLLPRTPSDPRARSEFEHVMKRVLDREPANVQARGLMTQYHLQLNDVPAAVAELRHVSGKDPWLRAQLGMLLKSMGQVEEGVKELGAAERELASANNAQLITVEGQQRLASVYLYLEKYPAAVELLTTAIDKESSPLLREKLAEAYVAWANSELQKQPIPWKDCMQRLQLALDIAPGNAAALQRIAEIAVYNDVPEAQQMLNEILAKGDAPGAVHLVLGTQALVAGDTNKAQVHLEQAYQQSTRTPTVLNNLAWVLAHKENPEPERALTLVEEALRLEPQNLTIHDTRGQILVKLERYKEAVTELELAIRELPPSQRGPVHASLATAYRGLGLTDLADNHQKLADAAIPMSPTSE